MPLPGQLRLRLEHGEDFRRDRLVVSAPNREAVTALDAWPGPDGGTLALIGPPGSGKTHLACAWAARTGAQILTDATMAGAGEPAGSGLLLLDAADAAPHGESLFHLLNRGARAGCALLLTGRTAPSGWPVDVADLRSRLNALPVIALGPPDDVILRGVLIKLFEARHIRPPEELIAYLLSRMERSVPAARAIVEALDEAASAAHRAISRALAREILHDDGEEDDGPGSAPATVDGGAPETI